MKYHLLQMVIDVKQLAHGHSANKCQAWDLNLSISDPEYGLITISLYYLFKCLPCRV